MDNDRARGSAASFLWFFSMSLLELTMIQSGATQLSDTGFLKGDSLMQAMTRQIKLNQP
jgi:hypothetical protein